MSNGESAVIDARGRRAKFWYDNAPRLLPIVPFAVLVVGWIVAYQIAQPNLATLPSVGQVWDSFVELAKTGDLWDNIGSSSGRWALGFLVGVVTGVAFGVAAGLNHFLARMLEPLATFFTAMSGIAWIPLAIVWFGIGTTTVVFVIWNSVFFLVFANTLLGVRLSQPVLEDAVRTLGGGRWHIICRVVVPGAMAHIMAGVRAGAGFGWRALIAAEIIGATSGLGAMIYEAEEYYRSDVIVAGIIAIALLGVIIDVLILSKIEQRTIERWGMVTVDGDR